MSPDDMNIVNDEVALELLKPQLYLLVAPHKALREMIGAVAARLSLEGPVRVLDGGNAYNAHAVARMVRRSAPSAGGRPSPQPPASDHPGSDPSAGDEALERIYVARAFTCYQMEALLAEQAAEPVPVLILDLLETFADENAPLAHRNYLMVQILEHLGRLSRQAPVLVGVAGNAGPPLDDYIVWLEQVAERVLRYERPEKKGQMRLF